MFIRRNIDIMLYQEVNLIEQFYQLLGIQPDPTLNTIVIFLAGIIILLTIQTTLNAFIKLLWGNYD